MDHKSFDDRIKEKLAELNPGYTTSSWDDMEDMLAHGVVKPWYHGWQAKAMLSGLILFSLINFYFLWEIKREKSTNNGELTALSGQTIVVDTIFVADTIYFTKSRPSKSLQQEKLRRNQINSTFRPRNWSNSDHPYFYSNLLSGKTVNSNFRQPLANPYILSNGQSVIKYKSNFTTNFFTEEIFPVGTDNSQIPDTVATIQIPDKTPLSMLSALALDYEIKKLAVKKRKVKRVYNANPRELRIGLFGGILVPDPDIGERYISEKFGIATQVSLAKYLHFVSGIHLSNFTYKLDEVDDNNFSPDELSKYPGYAELGRVPDEITIDNKLLQLPLHLRLYKNLNYNWSVFIAGGPTLDLLLNQSFKYNYIEIDDDQLVEVNEVTEEKDLKIYLGNFTGSFGIEHNFTRNLAGLISIDYQYGLGKLGVERRSVNSLSLNLGGYYKIK